MTNATMQINVAYRPTLGVADMTKILYHDNNISQYSDFFYFKKVFIILKYLIPYNFHNPCHQCQYQTNTSLKRERGRERKLNLTEDK